MSTVRDRVVNDYFEWLFKYVSGRRFPRGVSYRKLLMYLHSVEFVYSIRKDSNRYNDGVYLRFRFPELSEDEVREYLDDPCSVLEMMIALSIRCEETIMDNTEKGDRTGQWFWGMITNLGLGSCTDDNFDRKYVSEVIDCFLNREYEPDGTGGLFRIRDCHMDLRKMEIWQQLCLYLDQFET